MEESIHKIRNAAKKIREKNIWKKLEAYATEVRFCLERGAGIRDKVRLSWHTIKYHYGNALSDHLLSEVRTSSPIEFDVIINQQPHKVELRTVDGDFFILHEIFVDQPYWIPISHVREEARTVVDLGANIGMTTLYLHEWLPRADFLCVEANPRNIPLLRANTSRLDAHVDIVEGAISDQSGTVWFETEGPAWGTALTRDDTRGSVEVEAYTMRDLMEDYDIEHIDVLKVDIEGAEKKIFQDGEGWLEHVGWIMIELHDYTLEDFASDVEPYGFKVYRPSSELGNEGAVTAVNSHYHDVGASAAVAGAVL